MGDGFSFRLREGWREGASAYYSKAVTDCAFCRIVAGASPAEVEYEDDRVLAFKDIYPKAPVHILIVPKRHIPSIMAMEEADADLIGRCLLAARRLGEAKGFAERGYRVSVNCGPEGGQVVYHVHFHFIAGRRGTHA
jgi:histidine triad (HIT) family protein